MRVVVIDDEDLARRGIMARLSTRADVEVVGEASDASTAVAAIREHRPDLIFLDVEMPGMDGFGVLDLLSDAERPLTIFVTAFEDRAVEAFGVQALDYVLKPIDDARLSRAIDRAAARMSERRSNGVERLMIRDRGRLVAVDPPAIDWVQSDGDYVRLYVGHRSYLHHSPISAFADLLPPRLFVRIHRGAIVNVARIAELLPLTNGDYTVVLTTGARLKLARTRRAQLAGLLPL